MTNSKLFWRFAIILALFFLNPLSPLFPSLGTALIMFWVGRSWVNRRALPHNRLPYTFFLTALSIFLPLSGLVGQLFSALVPFTSLLWVGYAVTSRLSSRQARLTGKQPKALTNVAQLKMAVKDLDQQISQLQDLSQTADPGHYHHQAKLVLDQLRQLEENLNQQRQALDRTTYQRLVKRIATERQSIQDQLKRLAQPDADPHLILKVEELAPELLEVVRSVQLDVMTIERLIADSQSGNQAELLTLHKTNHQRFQTVLKGYLTIKANPNHYYDAQDRLATAQATLTRFADTLKEQVRQLNENDMHEFEVNLRLLNQTH